MSFYAFRIIYKFGSGLTEYARRRAIDSNFVPMPIRNSLYSARCSYKLAIIARSFPSIGMPITVL